MLARRGRHRSSCAGLAGSVRPRRSSSRRCSRSRRRASRSAARRRSPPTTAPSTSRSARYEHGEAREKEHERCGSHLVGPLLGTPAIGNVLAAARAGAVPARRARPRARSARSPPPPRSSAGWSRNPEHPLVAGAREARPRAPAPARHRGADAGAARGRRGRARRLPRARTWPPETRTRRAAPARDLRPAGREDARGLLHRRVLQPRARDAPAGRPPPAGRHAGLPEEARVPRRHGRGDRDPQALLARLGAADGARALRRRPRRAVGDRDDDRGRLHALRAPRDGLSRRARAAHADHDERRPRARGRERQADHLHAGAARPPSRADGRRLRGVRRRARSSARRSA